MKKNYINIFKEAKIAYKFREEITSYIVFSSFRTKHQNKYN